MYTANTNHSSNSCIFSRDTVTGKSISRSLERERQTDKTRQDYFIVRPPAHYIRREREGERLID